MAHEEEESIPLLKPVFYSWLLFFFENRSRYLFHHRRYTIYVLDSNKIRNIKAGDSESDILGFKSKCHPFLVWGLEKPHIPFVSVWPPATEEPENWPSPHSAVVEFKSVTCREILGAVDVDGNLMRVVHYFMEQPTVNSRSYPLEFFSSQHLNSSKPDMLLLFLADEGYSGCFHT